MVNESGRPVTTPASARWTIWHQDTFDRESPRQIEYSGIGLAQGLSQLWALHLSETVQADGMEGFSKFNLWWEQQRANINIAGDWQAQVRLRAWIIGDQQGGLQTVDQTRHMRLIKIAETHQKLLLQGASSEEIIQAARDAHDYDDFQSRLESLTVDDEPGPG